MVKENKMIKKYLMFVIVAISLFMFYAWIHHETRVCEICGKIHPCEPCAFLQEAPQ